MYRSASMKCQVERIVLDESLEVAIWRSIFISKCAGALSFLTVVRAAVYVKDEGVTTCATPSRNERSWHVLNPYDADCCYGWVNTIFIVNR